MIVLSSEFLMKITAIYTLSSLFLAVKFLDFREFNFYGVKIGPDNAELLAGAFAFATAVVTISASLKLLSDYSRTRVSDEMSDREFSALRRTNFHEGAGGRPTYAETYLGFILTTYMFWLMIEAILPIMIGLGISGYALLKAVAMLQEVTSSS